MRRQKTIENTTAAEETRDTKIASETEDETVAEKTGGEIRGKMRREPLDREKLKPEAVKYLVLGEDAKQKLQAAAAAVDLLGLKGSAKRLRRDAAKAYASAEREARRVWMAGSKEEREVAKKKRKEDKIAKLREQLQKLETEEKAAVGDGD